MNAKDIIARITMPTGTLTCRFDFANGSLRIMSDEEELAYWDKAEFFEDQELLANIIGFAVEHGINFTVEG